MKSNRTIATLLLFSLLLLVASCAKNISDDVVNVWAYDTPLFLQVEADSLSFTACNETSNEIAVNTEHEYTVTSDCDWLTFEQNEKGFTVTSKENTTLSARRAMVTISVKGLDKGKMEKSFPVSQGIHSLSIDTDSIAFENAGGTSSIITVETEGEYEISTKADWLTINKKGNKKFTISASNNETPFARKDSVVVFLSSLSEGSLECFIRVRQKEIYGYENGHEWVDLELPSGTLWATMNVGASTPEEIGDYFAWGETVPKNTYNWNTYKWCNGSSTTLIKYNASSSYGTVDNKTTLELSDDAAYFNWGDSWRMPTFEEWDELVNTANCTWSWTTQGGVNGYKVTSARNGNSIFLCTTGGYEDTKRHGVASTGGYLSSSLSEAYSNRVWGLYFDSEHVYCTNRCPRFIGYSIRPVCNQK